MNNNARMSSLSSYRKAVSKLDQLTKEMADVSELINFFAEAEDGIEKIIPPIDSIGSMFLSMEIFRADFLLQYNITDPGWRILLDLYIPEHRITGVSVTSSCIASRVASTTALRHIEGLLNLKVIRRKLDPKDKRRTFLFITASGKDIVETILKKNSTLIIDHLS